MNDSITHSKSYSSDVIGGIDPVTIDSSICSDNNHNDYEQAFLWRISIQEEKSLQQN